MSERHIEDLGNVDDLPEELKAQIARRVSGRVTNRQQEILDAVEARGGAATLNEIIVGIFRKTGKVRTRARVANMVKTMQKTKVLHPGKERGLYTTADPAKKAAAASPPPARCAARGVRGCRAGGADRRRTEAGAESLGAVQGRDERRRGRNPARHRLLPRPGRGPGAAIREGSR